MKSLTTTTLQSGSQFSRGVIESGFENMGYEDSSELTDQVIDRFDTVLKENGSTAFLNSDTSEVIGSIDEEDFNYTDLLNQSIEYVINNK